MNKLSTVNNEFFCARCDQYRKLSQLVKGKTYSACTICDNGSDCVSERTDKVKKARKISVKALKIKTRMDNMKAERELKNISNDNWMGE